MQDPERGLRDVCTGWVVCNQDSLVTQRIKNLPANARDGGSIPGLGWDFGGFRFPSTTVPGLGPDHDLPAIPTWAAEETRLLTVGSVVGR